MRRWLAERVGRHVYLRYEDEGRSILLTRVGLFTAEGIDPDGDEVCVTLRGLTSAFAGAKVTEGFDATRLLRRKFQMAASGDCDCDECLEKRKREAEGQLPPEEVEDLLAQWREREPAP
jgi:hypothetical protein